MWNDFVEVFGDRFEKKERFAKTFLFVSDLKTWVVWHDNAAKRHMHLMGGLCFAAGIVVGWLLPI